MHPGMDFGGPDEKEQIKYLWQRIKDLEAKVAQLETRLFLERNQWPYHYPMPHCLTRTANTNNEKNFPIL